ncbi:hypothetical protein BDK51DRAFT_52599 [Blyttiomyces helicus]|uniref:Uncharacterized protein n=1 Tax=Blyttiomyces helicus TaxID=388810 RepID=A0A4P9WJ37_9FUNG|nr:hypothetical protein BDK51DRAFT_52599 [Blyttiomyces helicus]|eukprot:RKO91150.1 hypothetical protein BDK51DRAFT_52599 [Blyttiomyces helicus]
MTDQAAIFAGTTSMLMRVNCTIRKMLTEYKGLEVEQASTNATTAPMDIDNPQRRGSTSESAAAPVVTHDRNTRAASRRISTSNPASATSGQAVEFGIGDMAGACIFELEVKIDLARMRRICYDAYCPFPAPLSHLARKAASPPTPALTSTPPQTAEYAIDDERFKNLGDRLMYLTEGMTIEGHEHVMGLCDQVAKRMVLVADRNEVIKAIDGALAKFH